EGWIGRDLAAIFPPAKTASDGRFTIHGIGRERLVTLSFAAPAVTSTEVYAVTRAEKMIEVPNSWNRGDEEAPILMHGSSFPMVLAPSKPIMGVVLDKETSRPLAGALIRGSHPPRTKTGLGLSRINVSTVADHEGRYVLTGLPKGAGNFISVGAP